MRESVARLYGVSPSTISRIDARWRAKTTPTPLAQLLDLPSLDQVLAGSKPARVPGARGRRRRIDWQAAAARLEADGLEAGGQARGDTAMSFRLDASSTP